MPKRICPRHGVHDGKRCPSCPQGGRRTTQHEIRSSRRWQRVAKFVRRRDGNRCTYGAFKGERFDSPDGRCTKTGPSLPVHHIADVERNPQLAFEPANCRTVCTTHHNRLENERRSNEARARREQGDGGPAAHWRLRSRDAGARPAPGTVSAADAAVARADAARGGLNR